MKNFPSLLAVIGAWLCVAGFVPFGIAAFIASSVYAIIVEEDTSIYTLLFFSANLVAAARITYAAI